LRSVSFTLPVAFVRVKAVGMLTEDCSAILIFCSSRNAETREKIIVHSFSPSTTLRPCAKINLFLMKKAAPDSLLNLFQNLNAAYNCGFVSTEKNAAKHLSQSSFGAFYLVAAGFVSDLSDQFTVYPDAACA